MTARLPASDLLLYGLVALDAVLLAILELFYLPLRLDGMLLPEVGDVPIPLSVLLALITTPLLVAQASKLVRPLLAALPLGLWILTLLVLGLAGPGGDHVLINDWRILLLLAAGALPAAVVLGSAQPALRQVSART